MTVGHNDVHPEALRTVETVRLALEARILDAIDAAAKSGEARTYANGFAENAVKCEISALIHQTRIESANDQDRADLREMLRLVREASEGKTSVYRMFDAADEIEKRAQARWGK